MTIDWAVTIELIAAFWALAFAIAFYIAERIAG